MRDRMEDDNLTPNFHHLYNSSQCACIQPLNSGISNGCVEVMIEDSPSPGHSLAQDVFSNADILQSILEELWFKITWNLRVRELCPLLRTNKPFFLSAFPLLWRELPCIYPAIKLIPCLESFNGVTEATDAKPDWQRFKLYASHIKFIFMLLDNEPEDSPSLLRQFLCLPGQPDPLFPNLGGIKFYSDPQVSTPSVLRLIILKPLTKLHLGIEHNYENFVDYLPELPLNATQLTHLTYRGAASKELFTHISMLRTLVRLKLEPTSTIAGEDLALLRRMRRLESIYIVLVEDATVTPASVPPSSIGSDVPGLTQATERLWGLRSLGIRAPGDAHYAISVSLDAPRLHNLSLILTEPSNPQTLHSTLTGYLLAPNARRDLKNLSLGGFVNTPGALLGPSSPTQSTPPWALSSYVNMQSISMLGLPNWAAESLLPIIRGSLPHLSSLTSLAFSSNHTASPPGTFPGLEYLQDIAQMCPKLEELLFQFDDDGIESPPGGGQWAHTVNSAAGVDHSNGSRYAHPLKVLTAANFLQLSEERTEDIAIYLHQLFPKLERVRFGYDRLGQLW